MVAVAGVVIQWVRCRPVYKAWVVSVDGTCFDRATSNAVGIAVQGKFHQDGVKAVEREWRRYIQWVGLTTFFCITACYAFVDIILVVLGYMLAWSKGLRLCEKAGIGFLGMLGLLLVPHLL